ncbi:MAG: alcohol dehydrogenase catalytic domain-containing protein [Chloroflexota bacterium]|nr:alcohol dehydrogenase catalytic domain-containing protein [Chloroflexota bacterium]
MRRAVFQGAGRITVEDGPAHEPGPGELLLRVHACALCGSDRGLWRDGSAFTPGHETAGTVEAVGAETAIPVGTFGAAFLVAYCGSCYLCTSGSRGACLRKEGMLGFDRDGGFAEYVLIPERCFLPLNPALDADNAVMLLDVVGTALHAVRRSGHHGSPPDSALVMGPDPLAWAVSWP